MGQAVALAAAADPAVVIVARFDRPELTAEGLVRVRESDLNGHLENEKVIDAAKDAHKSAMEAVEDGVLKQPAPVEKGSKDDYQLAQALNYLKGQPIVPTTPATPKQQLTARGDKH